MGADEIELKFLCEPQDVTALLAAAPPGLEETKHFTAVYFDTPDGHLQAAHVSLRLRESNGKRVQTLKRGDGFAREEHEAKVAGDTLNLTMPAVRTALKPAQRKALEPVFTVRVTRQQRTFTYAGAQIELALDQGDITTGDKRSILCELELELKSGDPAALFALARQLSVTAPLYLSFDGKASQGQALRAGTEREPRRHDKAPLRRGGTAGEAFQTIARNALVQIAANGLVLREAESQDALHQLRVAVRRLRSAMSTFKAVVDDPRVADLKAELKWLSGACDEARDLDVFAQDNLEIAGDRTPLAPKIAAARAQAHAKTAAAVASKRFRDLVLETTAWVETGAWRSGDRAGRSARDFAAKALDRRWKKLLKLGHDLRSLDDAGRHTARIAAKKLRYAAEAFAPLFTAQPGRRYIKKLKALQDTLGDLNDAAVAKTLVARLATDDSDAARDLISARDAKRPKALKTAARQMKALTEAKPFWR
ncbi:CYTH and CHAD domain-containing protein [Phenylobacterium sp.]|uniref:CYTH and CHAD domain-containing protein n=1 Tax=Phenylobacterium sp. TaxID=1871053 RepID=UPI002737F162|nr:CYTH and CHAD domain-containing protein [Phenylobacterium sp.]MDP3867270.1 CHAD domain-containing protein [Phenylobacterium sp.]